ncbi:probable methyltransferase TARBP1 [Caerostris darwini]|uniref:tRNA (guanosine(18)-2'-O)-methyltransferase TARBP1 n=1 Tax=Caerostris darwini TaxID=1538125 RepID=A0AAV4R899_9ARAC|nr:probable methyltransferase TARBP1 [Caerostris darwini]
MLLLWINRKEIKSTENLNNFNKQIAFVNYFENIKIWNDVVSIFESLEEKQIHVIKPVLPKLSRIFILVTKDNSTESNSMLISAWVMAIITRMLKHETKFVVRWAISTVLTLDYKKYSLHDDSLEILIKILLEAFNDQSLYSRNSEQDNYSLFLSSEKISEFLKNYLNALESHSSKVTFLRSLLNNIASQSWCIVALLHLIVALSTLGNIPSWNQSDISHIRKIVTDSQRTHEPTFRASLEYFMLKCCTAFVDWNSLKFRDLVELLSIFKTTAISRHSEPWDRLAERLKEFYCSESSKITQNNAISFCKNSISSMLEVPMTEFADADIEETEIEKTAKILTLLADSIDTTNVSFNWVSLLNPIISTIQCVSKRPYMHNKKFLSSVKLIILLIKEGYGCDKQKSDDHTSNIIECLNNCPEMFEFMFQKLFMDIESDSYIVQSKIFFEMFYVLSSEPKLNWLMKNNIPKIIETIDDLLNNVQHRNKLLFPLWKILVLQDKFVSNVSLLSIHSLNYNLLSKVLSDGILQECLSKPKGLEGLQKVNWLQYSYQSICDFWYVTSKVIDQFSDDEIVNLMLPLAEEVLKVLNNGPKIATPYAISSLKFIISKLGKHDLFKMSELLEISWKTCLELRGNEAFRPALSSLIEIIFQVEMLQKNFFHILDKYFRLFKDLSESTSGIFYTFIKKFCSAIPLCKLLKSDFNCTPIFVCALTFGPIHQKAHKIMEETLTFLLQNNPYLTPSVILVDSNKPSCYVRIAAVKYLLENFKNASKDFEIFLFLLIEELMKADSEDECKSTSHFANSLSHRIRNRAWQSILLIHSCIKDKTLNEKLLLKTLNALEMESQQPSIRHIQEWTIFNILYRESTFINEFISILEESLDKRPSYIISIISITNLLILHHLIECEENSRRCFKLLTIFCMAQNFTVRLYAQLALTNLFSLCQRKNMSSLIVQYEFVSKMMEMQMCLVGQGNFLKNVKKLSNDFYFSSFNPIIHFTLETIFYEFPRLSNLSPDEWVRPEWFEENISDIPSHNKDEKLKNSSRTSWSSKIINENSATETESLDYNFQKKIIPVKDIIEGDGNPDFAMFEEKKVRKDGLIVVASLIDRVPNLGGLCRTCEVFGVSEFVIGSFRYTEDKQFQNLSVSADKWVSMKEVKPHLLKEYLASMKEQGYVLIGAEQTEDSCNLKEFKFPKKSVLLLGHEKEGLPVDLIQFLDVCVEIPQQGVVRSLNVHVSGAILIWEYARQHNN